MARHMNIRDMVNETKRNMWKYLEVCRRLTLTNQRLMKKNRGAMAEMQEIIAEERMKDAQPPVKEWVNGLTAKKFLAKTTIMGMQAISMRNMAPNSHFSINWA